MQLSVIKFALEVSESAYCIVYHMWCRHQLLLCMVFVMPRYEGLVARGLEEIPPFLTRSAFAGSQRYGAILWSGDIESTFDELAVQVQVAQHVAMSGIYWW